MSMEFEPMCEDLMIPYDPIDSNIKEFFYKPPWYVRAYRYLRGRYLHLKSIQHRIKDYNRLQRDYSQTLIYATRHTLSLTNYDLENVKRTIASKQESYHLNKFAREFLHYIDVGADLKEIELRLRANLNNQHKNHDELNDPRAQ